MRTAPRLLCATAVLIALTGGSTARADGEPDIEGLLNETVVSAASKSAESATDAPAVISTISADDIRTFGMRTIDEAINYLGLGLIAQTGGTNNYGGIGGRGVFIAGDYGNHVLLLIDGHAVNEPWNGTSYYDAMSGIPIEMVDRIELVLGPGSVLYGSNAMLGVVNVVTKRAKDFSGLRVIGELSYSPSQNEAGTPDSLSPMNGGKRYRVGIGYGSTFKVFGQSGEITAGAELLDNVGPYFYFSPQAMVAPSVPYVWGGGRAQNSNTIVPSFYSRLLWGDFELKVRATTEWHNTADISTTFNQPSSYVRDGFAHIDLKYSTNLGERFAISARGYFDNYAYLEKDYYDTGNGCSLALTNTTTGCVFVDPGLSLWGGGELQLRYNWLADGRFVTLLGGELKYRKVSQAEDQLALPSLANPLGAYAVANVGDTVGSSYIQQVAQLWPWLRLNAGARVDVYEHYSPQVSPRAVAIVEPWRDGTLKLMYSQAFRAPSTFEQYYYSPGYTLQAPPLSPETVKSAEISFDQRVGTQSFHVSVFDAWWRNMIGPVSLTDGDIQTQNLSTITNYGATLAESGTKGAFSFGVNATIAWARRNFPASAPPTGTAATLYGLSQPIDSSPSLIANARIAYSFGDGLPTLALAAWLHGPQYATGALAYPSPPKIPTAADFRAALTGRLPMRAGILYRVGLDVATQTHALDLVGPAAGGYAVAPGTPPFAFDQLPRATLFVGLEHAF